MEAIAEAGVAIEVSTAGLRKPVGEIYPAPALLEMCVDAGLPDRAVLATRTCPSSSATATTEALELLERAGRERDLPSSSAAQRRMEPIG